MSLATVIQGVGFFFIPGLTLFLLSRSRRIPSWVGPLVMCYTLGVLFGNIGLPLDGDTTMGVVGIAILLGIPLLLLTVDLPAWLRLAPATALSFMLFCLSVAAVSTLSALFFANHVTDAWIVSGMFVGNYTGSAPNMAAIAQALNAQPSTFILVSTTDLMVASAYLFFLISPAIAIFGRLLRPFSAPPTEIVAARVEPVTGAGLYGLATVFGIVLMIAAVSVGISFLVPAGIRNIVAVIGVTTLGLLLSLHPRIRSIPGSYAFGEYFILVFCFAFGTLANFHALARQLESGLMMLLWTAIVMFGSVVVHALLCRLMNIDRDTAVITGAAGIYGPAVIGPVAANIKNPELIISGMTSALVGLAAGNYLGLMVAALVHRLLA